MYIQEFISGISILLTDDSVTFYLLLKINVFFFIKRLGVVSWAGLSTRVLDLAKIPDQIAVPPSACLLNIGRKIKAVIFTIEKEKQRQYT